MESNVNPPKYPIDLSPQQGAGIPHLVGALGRVTALLGVNGSGKSSALRRLRTYPAPSLQERHVVYVAGGRAITIPPNLDVNQDDFVKHGTLEIAEEAHRRHGPDPLDQRLRSALHVIRHRAEATKIRHSDAVSAWLRLPAGERSGDCPSCEPNPLDEFFAAFHDLFPRLELRRLGYHLYTYPSGGADADRYAAAQMSDGERQVFALLADVWSLSDDKSLFLIDEPELNLHPQMAIRLWSAIESKFPKGVFVYATHSLAFAMRPEVETIHVLRPGHASVALSSVAELEPDAVAEFLGAIPALVERSTILFTEGDPRESFDEPFYSWILGGSQSVKPVGDAQRVRSALKGQAIWRHAVPPVTVVGVVDRDHHRDDALRKFETQGGVVLALQEAESYLCAPELVVALGAKIHAAPAVTIADVEAAIREELVATQGRIAATRACERTRSNGGVTLPTAFWATPRDLVAIRNELIAQETAAQTGGSVPVAELFAEEDARCTAAAAPGQWASALQLVDGKAALRRVAALLGLDDSRAVMAAAAKHLRPDAFEHTAQLRRVLRARLGETGV